LSPEAEVSLVTREHDGYYSRPLLSRGFTRSDIEQSIILKTFEQLRAANINVISGTEVTAINRAEKTISLEGSCQETSLAYDKLIIAQGSAAFIPPPFMTYRELFFCLNSLTDLKALRQFRETFLNQNRHPSWAIIGGGLIGCEIASDLAVAGDDVTLFHAMDRLMERQLVVEDSELLLNVLDDSGVNVLLNQNVHGFAEEDDKLCVTTDVAAEFDAVVVCCGFKPRAELAAQAGLEIGRGIKVNSYLQTIDPDIFALGDVAELPNGKLYAFILPIRSQAFWLASFLAGQENLGWVPSAFTTKAKVHGFQAVHPYNL
jgi:NAD(P)H-nitrite reductase large subunit